MGRRVGIAVALLGLVVLAGCSASQNSGSSQAAAPAERQDAAPQVGKQTQAPGKQENAVAEPAAQNRQLVRTGSMELRAADVAGTLTRAKDAAIAQGGFTGAENLTDQRATATLRVPGDRLDAVMKAIGELPDVTVGERTVRTEDVTDQVVDVEARLANQRASVERVRGLLDRASSTSEITQIEAELTKRQGELESLQRRYDSLRGQVSMSTLTLSVSRTAEVVQGGDKAEDENFLTALGDGWGALTKAVSWLLIVIGSVLPFAVVLATPLIAYLAWRRRRKSAVTP
ncbi:DUF4349 domain-containing protein [Actinosynnema sp. NPDC047251]|uniref:DUF4349 domain-containing protein n=1 Tax=Saccharothrix espanaensis (strain ATCC 51144 / DSM 44229 / JCM 9112 / NBRC 15066 / NRRL 15764) TaxID=1179773 RepID=K0KFN2_SACES|nr:DUF4349 domain-containing protein [Saccharothrix espanaensis]CCH35333.1 hypothetical protein BN6_81160 [Saccharothrix espanaensis DSM 44229]